MDSNLTLGDVLDHANELPRSEELYLSRGDGAWTLQSLCIVWDPDDCREGQDLPAVVIERGFEPILGIAEVQGIVRNARLQKPVPSREELFRAFLFFLKNDAFIQL